MHTAIAPLHSGQDRISHVTEVRHLRSPYTFETLSKRVHSNLQFSRQFYIAQWFRDCSVEVEKVNKAQEKQSKDNTDAEELAKTLEKNQKILHHAERRKVFLLEQVNSKIGVFANFK